MKYLILESRFQRREQQKPLPRTQRNSRLKRGVRIQLPAAPEKVSQFSMYQTRV
jgi:hypothetical protein